MVDYTGLSPSGQLCAGLEWSRINLLHVQRSENVEHQENL